LDEVPEDGDVVVVAGVDVDVVVGEPAVTVKVTSW
jgi:hypothetical protein